MNKFKAINEAINELKNYKQNNKTKNMKIEELREYYTKRIKDKLTTNLVDISSY